MSSPDLEVQAYLDFAHRSGVVLHPAINVERTNSEGLGLSVAANATLPAGETVFRVPLSATISRLSDGQVWESANVAPLLAELSHLHAMALAVCSAAGSAGCADGPLAPWLALWPTTPDGSAGFSPEDWQDLRWCKPLARLHEGKTREARAAYDAQIVPHFASCSLPPPTWERFVWALSMAGSRAADVDMSGEWQPCLVPFVDLCNHRSETDASAVGRFDLAEQGIGEFVLSTTRELEAGDPITICYGRKENAELLATYGFALNPNPHDVVEVLVPFAPDDPLHAQKLAMLPRGILSESETGGAWASIAWLSDGEKDGDERDVDLTPELMMLLAVASAADVGEIFLAMSGASEPPTAAWQLLSDLCEQSLKELSLACPFIPESDSDASDTRLQSGHSPPTSNRSVYNAALAQSSLLHRVRKVAKQCCADGCAGDEEPVNDQ